MTDLAKRLNVELLAQAIHKSFGGDDECDHEPVRICYEYAVEQADEYARLAARDGDLVT